MKIDPRYLVDGWSYAHGSYSKEKGGAMCHEGRLHNDGYMTTVVCRIKGDYASCETCEHNPYYNNFVEKNSVVSESITPKYQRLIHPIPDYCTDCKNKSVCKNIQQGIIWCPNKVC
jgi:hypothetical protein